MTAPVPEPMSCDLSALSEGELVDVLEWVREEWGRRCDAGTDDLQAADERLRDVENLLVRKPCRTFRGLKTKLDLLVLEWPPIDGDSDAAGYAAVMADLEAVCALAPAAAPCPEER